MQYMTLGQTAMKASRITFGCWEMGGEKWKLTSDETNIQVVRTALENGVNSFDTAEGYGAGHSETILGKALEGRRKDCIIATKVSPENLNASSVRKSLEASLKRLRTDYVDIYYIHWPNPGIPMEETMSAFNKLKEEGLLRAIGVSNFSLEQLKEALKLGRIDLIQPEYSLLQRDIEKGILPFCSENRISVMSYSSIAKGILTGVFHIGQTQLAEDDFRAPRRLFLKAHMEKESELIHAMKKIADTRKITLSQLAISWLLHKEGLTSALVGTQNQKHLIENIKAADIELTGDEMGNLDAVSMRVLNSIDAS